MHLICLGLLNFMFLIQQAISMTQQLNLFKEYKQKLKEIAGEKRANAIISKSIYSVITGTDDLANTYFTTPFRSVEYDLPSYIEFVVQCASSFLQVWLIISSMDLFQLDSSDFKILNLNLNMTVLCFRF